MLSVPILILGSLWRHLLGDMVVGKSLVGAVVSEVALGMVGVVRLVSVWVLVVGCMCGGEWGGMGRSVVTKTI